MASEINGVFQEGLQEKIRSSKVLVVGAGGIGCEIIKNLVMCGFKDLEIIDKDTIEVSNLNRQFLYWERHVGMPKAFVARRSALEFNPNVKIRAYHDDILSIKYNVGFYKRFKLVFIALDNVAGRIHVNRMCLTAKILLIESGSFGYNGQVELIQQGVTQCYECSNISDLKPDLMYTIRNTPSKPVHCIIWAMLLFKQLFGEYDSDSGKKVSPLVSPDKTSNQERINQWINNGEFWTTYISDHEFLYQDLPEGDYQCQIFKTWLELEDLPEKVFNQFFYDDINVLLSLENLWKTRAPPTPIKFANLPFCYFNMHDHEVWCFRECQQAFIDSLDALKEKACIRTSKRLVWDTNDKDIMKFVTACANIRAIIFSIEQKSLLDVKSNLDFIPAIATTNAIAAGFVVLHAFKVLEEKYEKCQSVYIRSRVNHNNQIFISDQSLIPPNPKCCVCADINEVVLRVDTGSVTLKQLLADILIKKMNVIDPEVRLNGKIIVHSEEECDEEKLLSDIGIVDGCILKVDSNDRNYKLDVKIVHKTTEDDEPKFEIVAKCKRSLKTLDLAKQSQKPRGFISGKEDEVSANPRGAEKRKYQIVDDDEILPKRSRITKNEGNDQAWECRRLLRKAEKPASI